jgi:hypothetical protein
LCAALLSIPATSSPSDLFVWWQRDFLSVSLRPGDWVRIASLETGDGKAHADTLECHVLAAEGNLRWIGIWPSNSERWWVLRLDQQRLEDERSVEGAIQALYRLGARGEIHKEDLDELRKSQLFRRRLEDPFVDPTISEREVDDEILAGQTLRRRQIELNESREKIIPLGRKQEMIYFIELRSVADLSPDIPIFGLLRSHMTSEERTVRRDEAGGHIGPPAEVQRTERSLVCLDFGHGEARGVPDGLN